MIFILPFLLFCSASINASDGDQKKELALWQQQKEYFAQHKKLESPQVGEIIERSCLFYDDVDFVRQQKGSLNFDSCDYSRVRSVAMAKTLLDLNVTLSKERCEDRNDELRKSCRSLERILGLTPFGDALLTAKPCDCGPTVFFHDEALLVDPRLVIFYWSKGIDPVALNDQKQDALFNLVMKTTRQSQYRPFDDKEKRDTTSTKYQNAIRNLIAIGVPVENMMINSWIGLWQVDIKHRITITKLIAESCDARVKTKQAVKKALDNVILPQLASIIAEYHGHQCPDFVFEELSKIEKEK